VPSGSLDVKTWCRRVLDLPTKRTDPERHRIGTVIYPWAAPPGFHFARSVGVVYDLTPVILADTVPVEMRRAFERHCRQDIPNCDGILTISEATKIDLAWLVDFDPRRISVALPGPSQCIGGHAFDGACRRDPSKLLAVGVHHPRKNVQFLIDWFFRSEALPDGAELYCTGNRHRGENETQMPANNPHDRRLHVLGDVSDAQLCRLYQEVGCTVYPTLYEGFGFPVLDSLLHGTPVLSAYHSSLTEFEGAGVFYFDPCDPQTLENAWLDFQRAKTIHLRRDDLRQACSWDNVAQTLLRLCA
jgi:glycosyltransferase involved in cell wall biosynthesis